MAKFEISSIVRLASYFPAFVLPVARDSDGASFIQIINSKTGLIATMAQLSDPPADEALESGAIRIDIGDHGIFGYLDSRQGLHIGTIDEITPILRHAMNTRATPLVTRLSISELLQNRESARAIRSNLLSAVSGALGIRAGQEYINSDLTARVWQILEDNAADKESIRRIHSLRSNIVARLSDDIVEVNLERVDSGWLLLPKDKIIELINNEYMDRWPKPMSDAREITKLPSTIDPSMSQVMEAVRLSSRQEERLAILIRGLLVHPEAGRSAFDNYVDQSNYANKALEILRADLPIVDRRAGGTDLEVMVAANLPRLVSEGYPLRRGELLFYLAAHLGDFPKIEAAIMLILDQSRASDIVRFRAEIEGALLNKKPR